jgi:hypothetical protein
VHLRLILDHCSGVTEKGLQNCRQLREHGHIISPSPVF